MFSKFIYAAKQLVALLTDAGIIRIHCFALYNMHDL